MSWIAVGVAAATVVGTVAASSIQAGAARDAAETQAQGSDAAIALQREMWETARQDIAPWRQAGIRGLRQYERLAMRGPERRMPLHPRGYRFRPPTEADMMQDPGYQFRLSEGQRALERSASARGGLLSGGTLRGLEQYAQGVASQEYGNVYQRRLGENQLRYGRDMAFNEQRYGRSLTDWQQRLGAFGNLAYGGQQGSQQLVQAGQQYGQNISGLLTGQANALAAGQVGAANAWAQGISSLSNIGQQGLANYYYGQLLQRTPTPQAP